MKLERIKVILPNLFWSYEGNEFLVCGRYAVYSCHVTQHRQTGKPLRRTKRGDTESHYYGHPDVSKRIAEELYRWLENEK